MISPQTVELEDLNGVQGSRLKAPVPTNELIDRTPPVPLLLPEEPGYQIVSGRCR